MLSLSVSLSKPHPLSPSLAKHIKRSSCCPYQVFTSHPSTHSVLASPLAHGNTAQGCATELAQLTLSSHTVSGTASPPSRVGFWGKASFFAPSLGRQHVFAWKWFLSPHSSAHICSVITLQGTRFLLQPGIASEVWLSYGYTCACVHTICECIYAKVVSS